MEPIKPGQKYRHFKGGLYEIISVAKDSETLDDVVVYKSLYAKDNFPLGSLWTRTLKNFLEQKETEHGPVARFSLVDGNSRNKIVSFILIFGAVLVGMGAFSFVASNWDDITRAGKVLILLAAMFSSYGLGWYFGDRKKMERVGLAFMFLGSLFYGASIFLVAQIFNIRANWPDGFLLWFVGVAILFFAIQHKLFLYFATILSLISIFASPPIVLREFGQDFFLRASSSLLLISVVVSFVLTLKLSNKYLIHEGQDK